MVVPRVPKNTHMVVDSGSRKRAQVLTGLQSGMVVRRVERQASLLFILDLARWAFVINRRVAAGYPRKWAIRVKNEKAKSRVFGESEVVGSWSDSETLKSSTWRETEAVRRVVQSNVDVLRNKRIKIYLDNKNTTSVILNGSRCADIHAVASDIAVLCEDNNISMVTEWIPRVRNTEADLLSRCGDSDDWFISQSWFTYLDNIWGKHTVDRFSSAYNKQCDSFNSRWWVPGTDGVDAFCQDWATDINWLVPPPRLVVQCIRKLEADRAKGSLIVPKWPSAAFWPCIVNADGSYKSFITDYKILPRKGTVCPGKGNNGVFGKDPLPFNMLALRVIL